MSEAGSGKDNEQETADKKEDVQYKYRKKNLMKRIIITGILILAAGLCLAPVLFLLVGTFMGNHEIYTCIAPALGKGDGLAATIPDVAECCGAPFRFARIFSDVLELDFLHGGNSGRADAFWHAGSVGAGAVFFPRKKNSLPAVYSRDDDAVSGYASWQLSGAG